MPYIKQEDRANFEAFVGLLQAQDIRTAGELNYLITMIAHKYLNSKPESYQMYNDAIGALEGAKLELYRRHVSEYEDVKIKENGDV
jgi:hypothetical protein